MLLIYPIYTTKKLFINHTIIKLTIFLQKLILVVLTQLLIKGISFLLNLRIPNLITHNLYYYNLSKSR